VNPGLSLLDADTWTIGARTLGAANLAAYCAQRGGDGTIDRFPEWQSCVRTAAEAEAREAIALRWPRALEYFGALETELAAAPARSTMSNALVALVALDTAIEGATDDDKPEPPPPPVGLLVTGQTQCVQDDRTTGCVVLTRPSLLSRAENTILSPSSSTPRPHPPCSASA
jgi:hypothetical protein